MLRFYCECCCKAQPVTIESLRKDELNGDVAWGDIVCDTCSFVIVTISAEEEGVYRFVKVGDDTSVIEWKDIAKTDGT